MASRWENGTPVYDLLAGDSEPLRNENKSGIAWWLTRPLDEFLAGLRLKLIDEAARQADPLRCDPDRLDYLSRLAGYSGIYWDTSWPVDTKRLLIYYAFTLVWPYKGSAKVLSFVLDAFGIEHTLWQGSELLADITPLPAKIGIPQLKYYILLPLKYRRKGWHFKMAEKIDYLFGPAFCDSKVVYEDFFADISQAGEPVFSELDPTSVIDPTIDPSTGYLLATTDGKVIELNLPEEGYVLSTFTSKIPTDPDSSGDGSSILTESNQRIKTEDNNIIIPDI